jgi:cytochrome c biogenesis protein CcmG/thiol:disulfide interchange protein DsbE
MMRPRFPRKISLEAIAWALLLTVLGWRMWPQVAAAVGVDSSSERAPAFALTTLAGERVVSDSLRGKVVLVNFWATWCPPCRIEMPGFQQVYERHHAQGLEVLGVSTDALGGRHVADFLAERGVTYPVAMASGGISRDFGGITTLPTSFLIDREGRIRHQVRGYFSEVALERAVVRLLAEPADGGVPR